MKSFKKAIFALFAFVAMFMGFAQSKPVVVVAPFDAKGIDAEDMDILTEVFISEYANTGKADVVDRNSFDKIKSQLDFQSSDWSNTEKVAELGRALNANLVIVGQIRKMDDSLLAIIRVEDVNTTKILAALPRALSKVKDMNEALDKTTEWCEFLSAKASGENPAVSASSEFATAISETSVKEEPKVEEKNEEAKVAEISKKEEPKQPVRTYRIGDIGPAGGIVFYIEGRRGWECSKNLGKFSYSGAQSICTSYGQGGYTNWFLPGEELLNYIYVNLKQTGKIYNKDKFWSSTEQGYYRKSLIQNFSNGKKEWKWNYYGDVSYSVLLNFKEISLCLMK